MSYGGPWLQRGYSAEVLNEEQHQLPGCGTEGSTSATNFVLPMSQCQGGRRAPPRFAVTSWRRAGVRCQVPSLFLVLLVSHAWAAEPDINRLPPAASKQVSFSQDIAPILQGSCLKCHSDEKPRSRFRLTSREAALKGGDQGVDILPGNSAQSPLIQYVARLVPDMEMPPEGRGTALTADQIGLLRAWIDQGVAWDGSTNSSLDLATATPIVGWTTVHGDEKKFRELYWQKEGWNGGLEEFKIVENRAPDLKLTTEGHVLQDDYRILLEVQKTDLGFTRFGWTQFRKYYDDLGGYYAPFTPSIYSLNQDLHVDDGRAFAEIGLTLPRWPAVTLGYEHQYRDGTEATLQWGPVSNGTESRNIFPASKNLNEKVDILKLDLSYDVAGVNLSDSFRGEWYKLDTEQFNDSGFAPGGAGMALTTSSEHQTYFDGANTVHLEKQFTDWLFSSGGYLYSKRTSDGSQNVETVNAQFLDPASPIPLGWQGGSITLERDSHVFSVSTMLGPWEGLSLSLATQNEWTHQQGFTTTTVTVPLPSAPFVFAFEPPENLISDYDRSVFGQEAGLRFTALPFTTLFADARFQEDQLGQSQQEQNGLTPFLINTDVSGQLTDFRVGFITSPWRRVSWSADYRRSDHETHYDTTQKNFPGQIPEGYPGFITDRDLLSNQAQTKLALQTMSWLKTTLAYQWLANDYHTTTDPVTVDLMTGLPSDISPGNQVLAGTYDAQTASVNFTLTPWRRLFLSTTFSYQHARTVSDANANPSVAPYIGDIYGLSVSGNFALDSRTDLAAGFTFSSADFSQQNSADGLPLGIHYTQQALLTGIRRQIAKGKHIGLQYRYYNYDEPSSGGAANFQAHAVFATFTCRLQ
jgi:hypothetical protein